MARRNGPAAPSSKLPGSFYLGERRMKLLEMGNYDIFISLLSRELNPNYPSYFGGVFRRHSCRRELIMSPGSRGRCICHRKPG